MSTFVVCLLLCGVKVMTLALPPPHLTVLYNSGGSDGNYQNLLLKGTFLGLRDAEERHSLQLHPKFVDLGQNSANTGVENSANPWLESIISGNDSAHTIVSLLSAGQLRSFCDVLALKNVKGPLHILSPRSVGMIDCPSVSSVVTVTSMQMGLHARVLALLHRIVKVGTKGLLPILDDESQVPLLEVYKQVASRSAFDVKFLDPILMSKFSKDKGILLSRRNWTTTGVEEGVLLLSSKGLTFDLQNILIEEEHFFRWFSHEGVHEWNHGLHIFGLYSVQFVGSGHWDNVRRRRLLREFNLFSGPSPTILSIVLAYDCAEMAVAHIISGHAPQMSLEKGGSGLSGDLTIRNGFRHSGVFFGISTLKRSKDSVINVLQPSDWILEDLLEVTAGEKGEPVARNYQVATSSILSRHELLKIAQQGKGRRKCAGGEMEVMTHDPFNQMEYRFQFVPISLPEHLLIPNQYGYGLTFRCHGRDKEDGTTLHVACSPRGKSIGEPVHCFKSNVIRRQKRSPSYAYNMDSLYGSHYSKGGSYYSPREDTSMIYYMPTSMAPYYNTYPYYDSSTPGSMTTRIDVPINEDPTTHAPPTGGSKLPELRQILKAAKPFVGSCIGSTTGCAVCVLVLGRLPLGAVPAACTGPCFVGTFGTCGSLLGRVFSETTVVCTELFRQGLLDIDTFLADAEFGQEMAKYQPKILTGYQILATPLVERMKESATVTRIVAFFALPWAKYMEYLRGHSDEFNWFGYVIHTFGSLCCYVVGHFLSCVDLDGSVASIKSLGYSLGLLLIGLTVIFRQLTSRK